MARVLVTGGTGTLGRQLVPRLVSRGHEVRVLSRRSAPPLVSGASAVRGDLLEDDLHGVVSDIDVVIHAASKSGRAATRTQVEGTRNLLAAAGGRHLIYVSIVGVDRHRLPYYRAKRAAEKLVEASEADWSIQRATQFHDMLDRLLRKPVFFRTPNLRFQPVDPGEVSDRLVNLVDAGARGYAPDFGGPQVLGIDELNAVREQVIGHRARLVPLPRIGFLRDFDDGVHLCPNHTDGTVSWLEWLPDEKDRPRMRAYLALPAKLIAKAKRRLERTR
jgi:uncharacterized protein YbjT (DUF2867 family)